MTSSPSLYAVFGQPIDHSLSPVIHNAAFQGENRPMYYIPVECAPAELLDKLEAFRELGGSGVNLTRPLKELIIPHLKEASSWVLRTHAANTLAWHGDGWVGDNTDCQALLRLLPPAERSNQALILGSGGVARASQAALEEHGYRVSVAARGASQGTWAANLIHWNERLKARPWAVVVNATPLGQIGEEKEPQWPLPQEGGWAVDWVYRPRRTEFLEQAQEHGAHVLDGLCLLVEQASAAWNSWFGVDGPRNLMWKAVRPWR